MSVAPALSLPTRQDEDFRYSDLAALAGIWPVAREDIVIPAGQDATLTLIPEGGEAVARHLVITLGEGARFDLRVLNAGHAFGRIAVDVRLGRAADFTLGAAQLARGAQTL